MKKRNTGLIGILTALVLLASLLVPGTPVAAGENEWTVIENPFTGVRYIADSWAFGPDDIYFAGGKSVESVSQGAVLHYDGSGWTVDYIVADFFEGIWASSPSDIYAVGGNGICHYDGSSWTTVHTASSDLWEVWGTGPSDVYAVGSNGLLCQYDGTTWTESNIGPGEDILGLWGTAASDIWAAGYSGVMLHYDGSAWTSYDLGNWCYCSLWGTAFDNIYAVAYSGDDWSINAVFQWDGSAWTTLYSGIDIWIYDISGISPKNVCIAGYDHDLQNPVVCLYNGISWSVEELSALSGGAKTIVGAGIEYFAAGVMSSNGYNAVLHYSATGHQIEPVAEDILVTTDMNTAVGITLQASDVNDDPLTYTVGTPSHGTLTGTAPELTYTPDTDYYGWDNFTYSVNDGQDDSNTATVSIFVINPANVAPVADDQSVATDEDVPLPVTLTGSDDNGDVLFYEVLDKPSHGTLSGTGPDFTYTPDAEYSGGDSFTFKANDFLLDSNVATISITVNWVNDPPVANDQTVSTMHNSVAITLTASDVEDDPLTYEIVDNPAHGTLSGTAPEVTYTFDADYRGDDSFTFRAFDGEDYSEVVTVSITLGSWEVSYTRESNRPFNAVWGVASNDIYAVGGANAELAYPVYHYDGAGWSAMYCPSGGQLHSVWGSGPDDVWATPHYSSLIYHYNGSSWYGVDTGLEPNTYDAIWGSGPDDVYAVGGTYGDMVHYDGTGWTEVETPATATLYCIWGTGSDDIWAGGTHGVLIHYDGSEWSRMTNLPDLGVPTSIQGIWGSGPDDVYFVGIDAYDDGSGRDGVILHYDGTGWTVVADDIYEDLYGVHGTGPDDVFVCGGESNSPNEAIVMHYDGTAWSFISSGTTKTLSDVWTDGNGAAWFCDNRGNVYKYTYGYPTWDVNQDGSVNVLDMSLVGDHFGETGTPGWIPEDVNTDGSINVLDMSIIGDHFGE